MKRLFITADDYGVFPSINEGVISAVNTGKVSSVACLANHKDSLTNVRMLIDETGGKADIGCHLTISSGSPLTLDGDDVFTKGKRFRFFSELDIDKVEREKDKLKKELIAQVEVFETNGIPIQHLSCHHNTLTTTQSLFEVYLQVAEKFNVPMRSVNVYPTKKDSNYRLVLNLLLCDDAPPRKLREMRRFGKEILKFCADYKKVATPGVLESRHYGPLPFIDIWDGSWDRRVEKKHKDIKAFFKEFKEMECSHGELMLHLINYQSHLAGLDDEIDYPGINTKYFDSRDIEYRSVMGFDFAGHSPDVQLGRWGEIRLQV